MRSRRAAVAAVAVLPALLSACSAGSDDDTAAGTTPGGAAGCPASGTGVPSGTNSAPTVDVDGDGRPDTVWIAQQPGADGGVDFGVTTASGSTSSATLTSAGPVDRSVLVADVTGDGEPVALASDGRQVLLYTVSACTVVPVRDDAGRQYSFDLGSTGFGTGVGCADVDGDGTRDLVGLLADGPSITHTIVELAGPTAANGTSVTISDAGPGLLEEARQVTCGDLTLAADGVSSAG
ncbi:MAG TPA: hypothetical protein VGO74_02900 [Modestobacter sp.]|jgi:hypothetical protein|nr:hypothetical protein [Modestobacter sp.]